MVAALIASDSQQSAGIGVEACNGAGDDKSTFIL